MSNQQDSPSQNESVEGTEFLECTKCGQQVEQILALQCDHNLCLECAGKVVAKLARQFDLTKTTPPVRCEICSVSTMIDPSAIHILLEINQQRNSNFKSQQSNIQSPYKQEQEDYQIRTNMLTSLQYMDNPLTSQQFNEKTLPDTKQSMEPTKRQFETGSSFIQQQSEHSCPQHITEPAVLFCFTCQTQCFCMDCYLSGLHRNHDVKNAQKSIHQLKSSKVEQMYGRIQQSQELLLNEQQNVTNKRIELIDTISQAKLQIKQQFEELTNIIMRKEKELIQAADELIQDKLMEFDNEVNRIKQNFEVLTGYQHKLEDLFNETAPSMYLAVSAFNFISCNSKKIDHAIEQVQSSLKNQHPVLQFSYGLDPSSVTQQINDIRDVRLSVSALRGVEPIAPTSKEKYFLEQVKEERSKRFLQSRSENDSNLKLDNFPSNLNKQLDSETKRFQERFLKSDDIDQKENSFLNKFLTKQSNQKNIAKEEQQQSIQEMSFEQRFNVIRRKLCEQ